MLSLLLAALAAAAPAPPLDALPQTTLASELRCLLGAYALPGGRVLTITGDDGRPRALRYTAADGRFGALQEGPDGRFRGDDVEIRFAACADGRLTLGSGEHASTGTRLDTVEQETDFVSDGLRLRGKLVLPPGGRPRALAVWIEGSNNDPSTDDSVWPHELARRGVAVFAYDKRGTGRSAGAPSSDFHVRATRWPRCRPPGGWCRASRGWVYSAAARVAGWRPSSRRKRRWTSSSRRSRWPRGPSHRTARWWTSSCAMPASMPTHGSKRARSPR